MLWVTPIWAPVAVRFWTAAWNWAVSWMKTIGDAPRRVKAPAWNPLLNGVVAVAPQQAGRQGGVEGRERLRDLGLLDGGVVDRGQRAGPELHDPAPVFRGVGSKPPIGMPWAPSEMTRTTSELSRPILIASWRVIGQISCASGSLVVLGFAILGMASAACPGRSPA